MSDKKTTSSSKRRQRKKKQAQTGGVSASSSSANTENKAKKSGPETLTKGDLVGITANLSDEIKNALFKLSSKHPHLSAEQLVICLQDAVTPIVSQPNIKDSLATVHHERKTSKPIRVYVDGCFDITHSGHYNAVRQAKALGDILVVGVHSDAEILKHKGPPVMNEEERVATIRACKWVDEIEFDTPYDPSLELLNRLNCDFCVHGDDMPTTSDGRDAYAEVKQAGRLRIIKRTEGISTTDLVGRMLLMTNSHLVTPPSPGGPVSVLSSSVDSVTPVNLGASAAPSSASSASSVSHTDNKTAQPNGNATSSTKPAVESAISGFLPTTWRLSQFANHKPPKTGDRIIYIDGAFDLFHIGHIETLEKVKKHGDFLYVGIHDDATVNAHKGRNYPIMNLHERVLNVLSCKYVDEVVIGAPWLITKDLITTLAISLVITGSDGGKVDPKLETGADPYAVPKQLGIFKQVDTSRSLNTDDVIKRIIDNRLKYEKRNEKRVVKENNYFANKQFVAEVSN